MSASFNSISNDVKQRVLSSFLTAADVASTRRLNNESNKIDQDGCKIFGFQEPFAQAVEKHAKLALEFSTKERELSELKRKSSLVGRAAKFFISKTSSQPTTIWKHVILAIHNIMMSIFPFYKKKVLEQQAIEDLEKKVNDLTNELSIALRQKNHLLGEKIIMDLFGGEKGFNDLPSIKEAFTRDQADLLALFAIDFEDDNELTYPVMKGIDSAGSKYIVIKAKKECLLYSDFDSLLRHLDESEQEYSTFPAEPESCILRQLDESGTWEIFGNLFPKGVFISDGKPSGATGQEYLSTLKALIQNGQVTITESGRYLNMKRIISLV